MASPAAVAEVLLPVGQVVQERWRVMEKLGEGGFGAVYRVQDVGNNEEYAMKVESKKEQDSMVQIESIILRMLTNRKMLRHACQFVSDGDTSSFRFLVMQLLGRSLSDLRRASATQCFSASTTIRLVVQSLEAIETLHRIGFLHRDIKPGNFAIGCKPAEKRTVFMLDYGLCRQYIARDGQLRPPRASAGFRGTVKYASINTHLRKELGRHDDLWSLYYMMIELRSGELPWRKIQEKDQVLKKKQETTTEQLLKCMNEPEFFRMHDALSKLTYFETPNYVWFHLQLKSVALRNRYLEDDPFDWEPGGEAFEKGCQPPAKKKGKGKKKKAKERDEKVPGDEPDSGILPESGKEKEKDKEKDKEKEKGA